MRLLVLLTCSAVLAGPAMALPPDAGPQVAVRQQFHAALRAGDAKAAAALLADDLVVYEEGYAEDRAAYLSHHLASDISFSKATTSEVLKSRSAGDDRQAWLMSESSVRGTFGGKPVDRVSTETMVLRNTPVGWRIVHIHWSSRPAKAGS